MARKRFARPIREANIEDACRRLAEAEGGRLVKTVAIGWPGCCANRCSGGWLGMKT